MTRVPLGAVRTWLVPTAVLVLAVVVLWAAGGLRTVEATQGSPARAGQEIELARWVLVLHRLELTNRSTYGTESPPSVRLHLRATFTGDRSTYGMGPSLVTVQTPPGSPRIEDSPITNGQRHGDFDPDVPQDITVDFRWPEAPAVAPPTLRVLIRDEEEKENYLFPASWSAGANVALHVDLACADVRTGR